MQVVRKISIFVNNTTRNAAIYFIDFIFMTGRNISLVNYQAGSVLTP